MGIASQRGGDCVERVTIEKLKPPGTMSEGWFRRRKMGSKTFDGQLWAVRGQLGK